MAKKEVKLETEEIEVKEGGEKTLLNSSPFKLYGESITLKPLPKDHPITNDLWITEELAKSKNYGWTYGTEGDPTFYHVIIDNILYVLIGESIISIGSGRNSHRFDGTYEKDIKYIEKNDSIPIIQNRVYMIFSSITTNYLHISGDDKYGAVIKLGYSGLDAEDQISFNNNTTINHSQITGSTRLNFSNTIIKNTYIRDSAYCIFKNISLKDVSVVAKSSVHFSSDSYSTIEGLRFFGCAESLHIKTPFFGFGNDNYITIPKEDIGIQSYHRIHHGFFMGVSPIPFIKTERGMLVGGMELTLKGFTPFFEMLKSKMSNDSQDGRFSFSSVIGMSTDEFNKMFERLSGIYRGDPRPISEDKAYPTFDMKVNSNNERILLLAEQIQSRLKTFVELDALKV